MATKPKYSRIAQLKTAEEFQKYASEAGANLPFDENLTDESVAVFKEKIHLKSGKTIGNRLCILPMEGWDGTKDGKPTDFTRRRWTNFAKSGAKLLFGCEAVAVRHDGRANSRQLVMNEANFPEFEKEVAQFWKENNIFQKSIDNRTGAEDFVFYEGPPSANGMPGIHHVMSRTLKDLFCRYKTLQGYYQPSSTDKNT